MFHVTLKVEQIKRLAMSSVNNNRTHTSDTANQFSNCIRTNSCPTWPILNERVCEVIPHLWLSWLSTCMFLGFVPYSYMLLLNLHEGIVRPVHISYSFRTQCNHWQNKPDTEGHSVHKHKVLVHSTTIRVTNALLILSRKWNEPGQISFKDGVQVRRTLIRDPTITSNDAPHNLSRFYMQHSLNRSLYDYTRLTPLLKERN